MTPNGSSPRLDAPRYSRRTAIKTAVTLAGAATALSFPYISLAQRRPTIGIIVPSPIDDLGFSQAAKESMDRVKEALGIDYEIVGNVEDGDVTAILADLALRHDILISESNGYLTGTLPVAEEYPDKYFLVRNTEVPGPLPDNVCTYDLNFGSMGYVQGVIAGLLTKTNKIGSIDSIPILIRFANLRGIACGALKENPDVELLKGFIGSFYDPPRSQALGNSLVAQGCDVLVTGVNSPDAGVVAERHGIWAIGGIGNQGPAAPEGYATSVVTNIAPIITRAVEAILEGGWEAFRRSGGAPNHIVAPEDGIDGVLYLAEFNPRVPVEVQQRAQEVLALVESRRIGIPRVWNQDVCPDGRPVDVS